MYFVICFALYLILNFICIIKVRFQFRFFQAFNEAGVSPITLDMYKDALFVFSLFLVTVLLLEFFSSHVSSCNDKPTNFTKLHPVNLALLHCISVTKYMSSVIGALQLKL
jgi:hypothetical protein